ncbi:MAG: hypothetical protein LBI68_03400 [Azoarcus sp.]|jgi:hypothetical protein|nr:hypothetical protein [Azoarcus sp.]
MKNMFIALLALSCASGPLAAQSGSALRDPTRPLGWQEASDNILRGEENLRLELVWRKGEKQFAMISGTQLAVGGEIDGFRLVKIGDNEVTIENTQGRQVLRLTPVIERSDPKQEKKNETPGN